MADKGGRLLVISIVFLVTACSSPRFKAGDCVMQSAGFERWTVPGIVRIEEVGRRAYRVRARMSYISEWGAYEERDRGVLDHPSYYQIVPCPP